MVYSEYNLSNDDSNFVGHQEYENQTIIEYY